MLILSFIEIFATEQFNAALNVANFNREDALTWMRHSSLPAAQRLINRLAEKSATRTKPLTDTTLKADPNDAVLMEFGTKQVAQTLRAALAVYTYTVQDQRDGQACRLTFKENLCPTSLLNAGPFLQRVFGTQRNTNTLQFDEAPSVFKVLLWFHSINLLHDAVNKKTMSVKFTYRTGNIVGLVVRRVVEAWSLLLRRVGRENLSTYLLP